MVQLSAEIFYEILMYGGVGQDDMMTLWTECRGFSRAFKDAVERVFIGRHLDKTSLLINAGVCFDTNGRKVNFERTDFTFSHLDPEDRTCAVFSAAEGCPESRKQLLSERLASLFDDEDSTRPPKIVVCVRRAANDTDVPEWEADWGALQITCSWMMMYSEFFKEEKEHNRRLQAALTSPAVESMLRSLQANAYVDELSERSYYQNVVMTYIHSYEATRRTLRAERLKRNKYRRWSEIGINTELAWCDPDEPGFLRLKEIQFQLGMLGPYDDEEPIEEAE